MPSHPTASLGIDIGGSGIKGAPVDLEVGGAADLRSIEEQLHAAACAADGDVPPGAGADVSQADGIP